MKHLLIGFLSFFSLFNFSTQGDTDFDLSKIDYIDDNVIIVLKATSDNMMVIEQDFKYNPDEFELISVEANKYFTYSEGKEKTDGNMKSIKMLFDSNYAFKSVEYAQIKLKPKNDEQTGTIIVDNIHSSDLDYKYETVYGSKFEIITDNQEAKVIKQEYTFQNQLFTWVDENRPTILVVLFSFLGFLVVFKIIGLIVRKVRESKNPFKEVKQKPALFKKVEPKQYFTDQANAVNTQQQQLADQQAQEDLKEIEDKEKVDPISDDVFKGKYEVFILLLLVTSLFIGKAVFAAEKADLNQLRDVIVNEKSYVSSLDYNKDKKNNIVDIVHAIGTTDVTNKGYISFEALSEEQQKETSTTKTSTTEMGMQEMWGNVQ